MGRSLVPLTYRRPRTARRLGPVRLIAVTLVICVLGPSSMVSANLRTVHAVAAAARITPQAALERVLTAPQLQAAWFAPGFLSQVPVATVQQERAHIIATLGAFTGSTSEGNSTFLLHFQRGTAAAQIHLDTAGRIDGLLVTNLQSTQAQAAGTPLTPQAALNRVFSSPLPLPSWFAPTFLAKVTTADIQRTVAGFISSLGSYSAVTVQANGSFQAHYLYGSITGMVHLDQQGRIATLRIAGIAYIPLSRSAALAGLRQLPGTVSLLVLANGAPVLTVGSVRPLAVGSAFKLAVLAAVQQEVAAHRLSWTHKVTLQAQDISLPSGVLQTEPVGSRYPIAEVAQDMIALSDNTAANILIRIAGRQAIDALIPVADQPILTTRELFVLKDPANTALRDHYLAAVNPQARMTILPAIDALPLPSAGIFTRGKPVAPQVEWYFSTSQLCGLMRTVASLPQMQVNPGVATAVDWTHVAYKGGSEPGVLNLTTQVTALNGTTYCVAATWNNPAQVLNEPQFEQFYANVLQSYKSAR